MCEREVNWIHRWYRCYQETTATRNDSHDGEISTGVLIVRVKLARDSFCDTLQGERYEMSFVQLFEHLKVPDESVTRYESEIRILSFNYLYVSRARIIKWLNYTFVLCMSCILLCLFFKKELFLQSLLMSLWQCIINKGKFFKIYYDILFIVINWFFYGCVAKIILKFQRRIRRNILYLLIFINNVKKYDLLMRIY